MYGVVTQTSPLEVTVDQRLPLSADFLIVPEHMTAYSVTVDGQTVEIRRGIEEGDRLVLLRSMGAEITSFWGGCHEHIASRGHAGNGGHGPNEPYVPDRFRQGADRGHDRRG
nr:DUF2577 family protein [Cohnella algarum]